jgi:hypothetical protein
MSFGDGTASSPASEASVGDLYIFPQDAQTAFGLGMTKKAQPNDIAPNGRTFSLEST